MLLLGPPLNVLVLLDSGRGRCAVARAGADARGGGARTGAGRAGARGALEARAPGGGGGGRGGGGGLADAPPRAPRRAPGAAAARRAAWAAGCSSGALTTSISVSGPPIVLWLEALGLRPGAAAGVAGGVVPGPEPGRRGGGGGGRRDRAGAPRRAGRRSSCSSLVGHALGVRAFRRLAGPRFSLVALGLVICAGLASLVAGAVRRLAEAGLVRVRCACCCLVIAGPSEVRRRRVAPPDSD